jgi:hypothetical protein
LEQVGAGFSPVIKVEMECNGNVLEHAPYFPVGSDDYERISTVIARLLTKQTDESQ